VIRLSASFGISNKESLNKIKKAEVPIQLGLYKVGPYIELESEILEIVQSNNIVVNVVHLPINCLSFDFQQTINVVKLFKKVCGCYKYVIHPNRNIRDFLNFFINDAVSDNLELCIETFQWRRRKPLRSPLDIYEACLSSPNFKITFDTSHVEDVWFDHKIFKFLAPKISVIHLSNRTGRHQHKPFNCSDGDLNLESFVKLLKRNYNWEGDIVLEYMAEYSDKIYGNLSYLEKLLE
jgi:hypothetical protein